MRDVGRWTALVAGTLATFAGATVSSWLVLTMAVMGNCGPRWGVPCTDGREYLIPGVLALVFGGILLAWAASLPGRTGPAGAAAGVAAGYGLVGASVAAVAGIIVTEGPVLWRVVIGVIAVVPPLVLWAMLNAMKENGVKRTYWYLDVSELRYERPTYPKEKDDTTFRVIPAPEEAGTIRAFWALYLILGLLGAALGQVYVSAVL